MTAPGDRVAAGAEPTHPSAAAPRHTGSGTGAVSRSGPTVPTVPDTHQLRGRELVQASWVAARSSGHMHRLAARGGTRPERVWATCYDLLLLASAPAWVPLLAVYRVLPGHTVVATTGLDAVAHVHRRRESGSTTWWVTDVAGWPYRTGAGARLIQGLQQQATDAGAVLELRAENHRLVDRFYVPLGFVPAGPKGRLSWSPPTGATELTVPAPPHRGPLTDDP